LSGGNHTRSKRLHVPIRFPDQWAEYRHGSEVFAILAASAFISGASPRADQCLGRAGAFSHVRQIQAMTVDLLVQVLTAILPYAEAMHSGGGINNQGLQFTTIKGALLEIPEA
jgi:hypothetical protein